MKKINLFLPLSLITIGSPCFAQHSKRPNILWLTFEDTSPQFIGCYGNKMAKTPVMDGLAKDGVRFDNAYSTGTVSSPSRFCLITGCHAATYGTDNHRSNYGIPDFVHGFPEYLRKAGYYTTNNYKTDYNHNKHREMAAASWNECSGKATWRGRKSGQPFFAVFNSIHSHQSRTMTNPWDVYEKQVLKYLSPERKLAENADFEIPPFYSNSGDMRKQVSRIYNSISLTDQQFGRILQDLEKDGLKDSTIIFVYADHGEGMPRGKGSSLGTGYKVPFILWIPEMYKDLTPWGSGVVTDELISFEDLGATVLSLAGVEIPEYIEGKPFLPAKKEISKKYVFGACDAVDSNIELARSVMDGQYVYTRVFTPYQPFVRWISYYDHADIQKIMRKEYADGILNNVQKEILEPRLEEYLYDLKNDKWETNNLANDKRYVSKLNELREAMKSNIIKTRDANFIPEYSIDLMEKKDSMIPYYFAKNNKNYPIKDIVETAMIMGNSKKSIKTLISKLNSENDFVSYWAAIQLFTRRTILKPYLHDLKVSLDKIKFPPSKIWLSGAILDNTDYNNAREVINGYMLDENNYLILQVLNVLTNNDLNVAKTFVPKIEELNKKGIKDYGVQSMLNVARLRLENISYNFSGYW